MRMKIGVITDNIISRRNAQNTMHAQSPADIAWRRDGSVWIAILLVVFVLALGIYAVIKISKRQYEIRYEDSIEFIEKAKEASTLDAWQLADQKARATANSFFRFFADISEAKKRVAYTDEAMKEFIIYRGLLQDARSANNEAIRLGGFDAWRNAYRRAKVTCESKYATYGNIDEAKSLLDGASAPFFAAAKQLLDEADTALRNAANQEPRSLTHDSFSVPAAKAQKVLESANARQFHSRANEITRHAAAAYEHLVQYTNLLDIAERTRTEALRQNTPQIWVRLWQEARDASATGYSRYGNTSRAGQLALEAEESLWMLSANWLKIARDTGEMSERENAYDYCREVLETMVGMEISQTWRNNASRDLAALPDERSEFDVYRSLLHNAEAAKQRATAGRDATKWIMAADAARSASECKYSRFGSVSDAMNLYDIAKATAVSLLNESLEAIQRQLDAANASMAGIERVKAYEEVSNNAKQLYDTIPESYRGLVASDASEIAKEADRALLSGIAFGWHKSAIRAFALSKGRFAASSCAGSENEILVWDINTGRWIATLKAHTDFVTSLAFSPDGEYLVSGGWDGRIIVWRSLLWNKEIELMGHDDKVTALAFSQDGSRLAAGLWKGGLALWRFSGYRLLYVVERHKNAILCISFSPNGRRIATGGGDEMIFVTDKDTGEETRKIAAHKAAVYGVCYSSDGATLGAAGLDGIASFWETNTYSLVKFVPAKQQLYSISFLFEDKVFCSLCEDGAVRFWDIASEHELQSFGSGSKFGAPALTGDGKYLLFPCRDGKIAIHIVERIPQSVKR